MSSELRTESSPPIAITLVEITLNGETRAVRSSSIAALLEELQLLGKKVAVEQNRNIVRKELYPETAINAGDQIEIIHFVGGG